MSGLRPALGFFVAVPVLSFAPAFAADDVGDAFQQGISMLERGRDAEALRAFQNVLSLDPSGERALELWQQPGSDKLLDLLGMGGEYERVGTAILDLVRTGRTEVRDDPGRIRDLLNTIVNGEVADRREALYQLGNNHGEFVVPYTLAGLADQSDEDRRVAYMQALSEMGGRVVLPLIAALGSDDGFLRRNVATVLGLIGDRRAAPALAHIVESDAEAQIAARDALSRMGASGDSATLHRSLGLAYLTGSSDVLAPSKVSDVVWSWGENGLESNKVAGSLYGATLAQDAYFEALNMAGASLDSRAGVALSSAALAARIAAMEDPGDNDPSSAELAVAVSGPDAADQALQMAMAIHDHGAAILLARSLGETARGNSAGLIAALGQHENAGLRGEAAASLASVAVRSGQSASAEVVQALGEAAARQALRVAVIIDADAGRSGQAGDALMSMGVASVHKFTTGAKGLVGLSRMPGADVILLADSLPDLTTDQVLDQIRDRSETPVLILARDADAADELYGEKAQGSITDGDFSMVSDVMGELDGDRALAVELGKRAADALALLATSASTDLSGVAGLLADALEGGDATAGAALSALRACGTAGQADAVAAVLADSGRDDSVRVVAASALGGIFDREPTASDAVLSALREAGDSEAPIELRRAALGALGRLDLSADARAELLGALH